MIYAKIEKSTKKLIQFIGVNSSEMLEFQKEQAPDCFFVESLHFGSPTDFQYDAVTGKIERLEK